MERRQRSASQSIHTDSKSNIEKGRDCGAAGARDRAPGPLRRTRPASSTARSNKPLPHLRACVWCFCGLVAHNFAHSVVTGERLLNLAHALLGERAERLGPMLLLPQRRGVGVRLRREPLHHGVDSGAHMLIRDSTSPRRHCPPGSCSCG